MNKLFPLFIIPIITFSQEIQSTLPLIIINTNNQTIVDDPRIICDMKIINNDHGINSTSDTYTDYNGKISI